MTLLVKRRSLLLFATGGVVVTVTVAALAYAAIRSLDAASGVEAKLLAERVLLVGIIGSSLMAVLGVVVAVRAFRLSAQLDKLVEMNRLTGFSPEVALGHMGDVGAKIRALYAQLSDLSEKKSLKISSLMALTDHLLATTRDMIVVADASGHIVRTSRPLLDRLGENRKDVVGLHLDSLIPGAEAGSAIIEMSRTRTPLVRERRGDSLVFTPVINRAGDVTYLVATLTRTVTNEMRERTARAKGPAPATSSPGGRRRNFISRLLRGRAG